MPPPHCLYHSGMVSGNISLGEKYIKHSWKEWRPTTSQDPKAWWLMSWHQVQDDILRGFLSMFWQVRADLVAWERSTPTNGFNVVADWSQCEQTARSNSLFQLAATNNYFIHPIIYQLIYHYKIYILKKTTTKKNKNKNLIACIHSPKWHLPIVKNSKFTPGNDKEKQQILTFKKLIWCQNTEFIFFRSISWLIGAALISTENKGWKKRAAA